MKCPTCGGLIMEACEETILGVRLQVVRCVNGHRFEREKPKRGDLPNHPAPVPVTVAEVEPEREEPVDMGKYVKTAACKECERVMPISGRGLCGKCYGAQLRAEKRAKKASAPSVPARPKRQKLPPKMDAEERMVAIETPQQPGRSAFALDLDCVLAELRALLISKNVAYGDSALSPVRVFSQADPVEQLRVRIDDKISRLMRGADAGEDTVGDLLGYLVLLRIAERRA